MLQLIELRRLTVHLDQIIYSALSKHLRLILVKKSPRKIRRRAIDRTGRSRFNACLTTSLPPLNLTTLLRIERPFLSHKKIKSNMAVFHLSTPYASLLSSQPKVHCQALILNPLVSMKMMLIVGTKSSTRLWLTGKLSKGWL